MLLASIEFSYLLIFLDLLSLHDLKLSFAFALIILLLPQLWSAFKFPHSEHSLFDYQHGSCHPITHYATRVKGVKIFQLKGSFLLEN